MIARFAPNATIVGHLTSSFVTWPYTDYVINCNRYQRVG
jgi:hypothetical protein